MTVLDHGNPRTTYETGAVRENPTGKGRYDLWKKGKITFRDLVDQNGRELTLAQLKELADE